MAPIDHTGHGEITLALTETHADGAMLYQAWGVCSCLLSPLRDQLGTPRTEAYATAEQVEAQGRAISQIPGVTRIGEGL